jgi:hypothetical protein
VATEGIEVPILRGIEVPVLQRRSKMCPSSMCAHGRQLVCRTSQEACDAEWLTGLTRRRHIGGIRWEKMSVVVSNLDSCSWLVGSARVIRRVAYCLEHVESGAVTVSMTYISLADVHHWWSSNIKNFLAGLRFCQQL